MLRYLHLKNVGPAPEMTLELAPRLNLITGDNGLGKSFLLDVAWWALTRRWPAEVNLKASAGLMARPFTSGEAIIEYSFKGKMGKPSQTCLYDRRDECWTGKPGRPGNPGLVLYAQVDGGFSVWDPARNYWKSKTPDGQERQPAFVFSAKEIWDGLVSGSTQLCNGLIADWALWQKEGGEAFSQLSDVLSLLSPSPEEKLAPGELGKISIVDSRWMPTLKMPYGMDVPLPMASAGMKRVVALAYLLVWSWQEHTRAAKLLDEKPTSQVTFLIDEIECHLHPRWQRTMVRALLKVMKAVAKKATVQLVAATHSPLLMASVEPLFDATQDAWFDLDLELPKENEQRPKAKLRKRDFVRHGDVSNWLTSNAFDLKSARSIEAEVAIEKAKALLRRKRKPTIREVQSVDRELEKAGLPDIDPFWARWKVFMESLGGAE